MCRLLESCGIEVKGYIVSDNQRKPHLDKSVCYISEIVQDDCTIILGMSLGDQKLLSLNNGDYIQMNEQVLEFLRDYM